jgi:hypothetical protein
MNVWKVLGGIALVIVLMTLMVWVITGVFLLFSARPVFMTSVLLVALAATVFYGPVRDEIKRKKKEKK